MGSKNQIVPPGFVRFEPFLHHRLLQRFRAPLHTGYDIYIWKQAQDFLSILSPYQLLEVSRKIYSLAANPRPEDARHKKNTVDKLYVLDTKTSFSVEYEIMNGAVYVKSIIPDLKAKGEHKEIPGVYHVKKNPVIGRWDAVRLTGYEVKTKYAAVNGQSNVLDHAKGLMASHVSYAYDKELTEYTLFHNPSDGGIWDTYESSQDKKGKTTGVTKEFYKVLAGVQAGGTPVGWVAHSQGGVIFTEAVRYHWEQGSGSLDKNSVWFHAGANSQKKTDRYLPAAGIKVHGYNDHPFDLVPQLIGGHATSVSNVVGSVLHAGYVFMGAPERSPHTLPYQGMDNYVEQMPSAYQTVYRGAKAVEDTAAGAFQYVQNIPSRVKVMFKLNK